jgi:uncharacterized protein involved in exopolysaccharide biosynthesis
MAGFEMTNHPMAHGPVPLHPIEWQGDSAGRARTITASQAVALIRRRSWIVVLGLILGFAGAVIFVASSEPRYIATSQVIIDPRGLRVVEREVNPSTDNADGQVATVENEMRVLKSSEVLDALITRLGLDQDPEFVGDPPGALGRLKSTVLDLFRTPPTTREPAPRIAALQALDRKIAVRRAERSFVVEVTVASREAEKSARIANELVAIYIEQANKTRAELARRSGVSLDGRLAELRAAAREAEDRVEAFKVRNDLVRADGVLTRDRRLRDLNEQLVAAQSRAAEARARLEQVTAPGDKLGGSPEAMQSQTVTQFRGQIAEAKRRRANLANLLGLRHPELTSLNQEITELQEQLDQELRRIVDAARANYQRAKQVEESLRKAVTNLSQASFTDSRALSQLQDLVREAEARRTLFTQFLVRSRELAEQTRVDVSNIRPISSAIPPTGPANLSKTIVIGLGTLIGLAAGLMATLVLGLLRGETRPGTDPAARRLQAAAPPLRRPAGPGEVQGRAP